MSLVLTTTITVYGLLQTAQTPPGAISGEVMTMKYRLAGQPWSTSQAMPATDANGNASIQVIGLNVGSQYDFHVDYAGNVIKGFAASFGEALAQTVVVGTTVTVTVK